MSRDWDSAYRGEPPPWDIGRPQPIVVRIADEGGFGDNVLDAGCGTGENALFLAGRGLDVTGVDWSGRAIEAAQAKAAERRLEATFLATDALDLPALGRSFDSALDSGLFHTFDDEKRTRYVRSLASVMMPRASLHLLCFSELEPGDWGPRRVTQAEIREAFEHGWRVVEIEPFRFATRLGVNSAAAWHATLERSP